MKEIIVIALLSIGVLGFLFTSLGLLLTRDVYDQIQYLAPASLIGGPAMALAVLVHEGFNQAGVKSIFVALLLFVANPILSHTTARAARVRHRGQWQVGEEEELTVEERER